MNRRISTVVVALVPIVAFFVLLSAVTVPYVSLGPGPTFNTIGDFDGKTVVDIEGAGAELHATSGHLDMTTVSQSDGLKLGQAIALWLSGTEQLVPRDLVYPPDKSRDEVNQSNAEDFQRSELFAQDAALNYLGKFPKAVTVTTVSDPGPSQGKLEPGDAIDLIDGKPMPNRDAVMERLKDTKPGDQLVIDYRRRTGELGTTTVTLGSSPDRPNGLLGVMLRDAPFAPFTIDFNLANVGGPSAGLMFSLAVVDKLTTGELNGGKYIAGTGTIDGEGKVGAIGGITHKILAAHEKGATAFLVPADNCAEAKTAHEDGLELIKVNTLGEAVDALKTYSAGGEPPRC